MNRLMERYRNHSDPVSSERRVELLVLIAALLLVMQILWGLLRVVAPGTPDPVSPTPESMRVAALNGVDRVAPEARDEIRRRPLFWASREPLTVVPVEEKVAAEPQQKSAKPLKGVRITGVFGVGDDAGVILISQGKKRRLMVGQEIDGWKLSTVEPTEATLLNGSNETSLSLERTALMASATAPDSGAADSKNNDVSDKESKAVKKKIEAASKAPEGLGLGSGDRARSKTK